MIDRDVIDQIRTMTDIVDLISEYVRLKKAGANHKGLCPFHKEKTPSFMVNRSKGIFRCFGCGKGGDAFRFLMEHEGFTFLEAVEFLARRAGVILPERSRGGGAERQELRERIYELNRRALVLFRQGLAGAEGAAARRYLESRGFEPATIERFELGYARDEWRALSSALQRQGATVAQLQAAGLVVTPESGGAPYDRFRNRLVLPIRDIYQRIRGFGGRALGDETPKYLNTPETEVFKKSRLLFGLPLARESIRERKQVVVVEGYFDVAMLHQVGLGNAVAPLGTALTAEHVALLKRQGAQLVLLFDGDEAGRKAARRSLELLFELGHPQAFVALLPAGKDPDDLAREAGAAAVQAVIDDALEGIEFLLADALERHSAASPEGPLAVARELIPFLARLPGALVRGTYISHVARRIGIKEELLARSIGRPGRDRGRPSRFDRRRPVSESRNAIEEQLIWVLLNFPDLIPDAFERLEPEDFSQVSLRCIAAAMQQAMFSDEGPTLNALNARLSDEESRQQLLRLAFPVWEGWELEGVDREATLEGCLARLQQRRAMREGEKLQAELAARRESDEEINRLLSAICYTS